MKLSRIRYNSDSMKIISLFESLTGARVKDCITNDAITFVVQENEMGKAIGKKGANIKRLEQALHKKIRLVEYSSDIKKFVKNLIQPAEAAVEEEGRVVRIKAADSKTKGILIGRDRKRINKVNELVKRYFDVDRVVVES